MKIFLTGASGFIGRSLYPVLIKKHEVICAVHEKSASDQSQHYLFDRACHFKSLNAKTDFGEALKDIDVVIHLAAKAHMLIKSDYDLYKDFMDINFYATKNLAEQAVQKKVKRFIFISSIGVNGKYTEPGQAYKEEGEENPYNGYTVSKFKAEKALKKLEAENDMELVIIRPPLVYGPTVKANFLNLLNFVHSRFPLPFAGIKNKRSFISIDNLVDAIAVCAVHEKAAGETFHVCDGEPVSTPELLRKTSAAFGLRPRLFNLPAPFIKMILTLWNKKGIYDRLWGNLVVDSTKIRQHLGWQPKVTMDEAIKKTVQWYLEENRYKKGILKKLYAGFKKRN